MKGNWDKDTISGFQLQRDEPCEQGGGAAVTVVLILRNQGVNFWVMKIA
jgi:hypothetical protein